MLPCAAYPVPVRCPAQAWHSSPVYDAAAALSVDDAELSLGAAVVGLGQPHDDLVGGQTVASSARPSGP